MTTNHDDERKFSRRVHRQAAIDSMELAEQEREYGERDQQEITYWQRDSLIHALLALSAET